LIFGKSMICVQNVHSATLSEIIRRHHRGVPEFFLKIYHLHKRNYEIRPKRRVEMPTVFYPINSVTKYQFGKEY